MPLLLLLLALVADVGALQVERLHLRAVEDTALVGAATEVDHAYYDGNGSLRLDPGAEQVFRDYLLANLAPLRSRMAAGVTPESVAAQAEVAVINQLPATDPYTGRRLDRPSICARFRVPVPTSLLALAGLGSVQTLTVAGDAEVREDG